MNPLSSPNSYTQYGNQFGQPKPQTGPQLDRLEQLKRNQQKEKNQDKKTSSRQSTRCDNYLKGLQKSNKNGQRANIQNNPVKDDIDNQQKSSKVQSASSMEEQNSQSYNYKRNRSINSKGQQPTKKIKLTKKIQMMNVPRRKLNVQAQNSDRAHAHQVPSSDNGRNKRSRNIEGEEKEQYPQIQNVNPLLRIASQNTPQFNIPFDQQQQKQNHSQLQSSSQSSENNYHNQYQDQHEPNHLQQSDYSSQQKYTIHESQLYIEFSDNMPNHPKKYIQDMKPKDVTYRKYTQKGRDSIKKSRNISIGHESFYLCHQNVPIKMDDFIKSNWINLIQINFSNCRLTNKQFKKFVDNSKQYKYIKMLCLSCNKNLTTVTAQMLSQFPLLEYVNFGDDSDKCHLNAQSIEQIKRYMQSHPKVKVIYCQSN